MQYIIEDTTLTEIANAIREMTGETAAIPVPSMASKIRSIGTSAASETETE